LTNREVIRGLFLRDEGEVLMERVERFAGQLWDADHVVFDHVIGALDPGATGSIEGASGCFEIHQGGILGGGASLATDREYRLVLEDGKMWQIQLDKVGSSNSAGIARIDFHIDVGSGPGTAPGMPQP